MSEVFQCVLKLPMKLRLPILLFYYDDHSLHEVADILGLNEQTCRVRLFRARMKLREMLEEADTNDSK
ncbi:MAG: hypothetical protein K6T83_02585 [Alicyclobacillus sp.]|nr:hypothetical protein [Alicyclobacillus sp.]